MAGTRERPGPILPWLGTKGRLKGIKDWLRTYQGIDLDGQVNQKQVPVVRTDFTTFYDGVVLKNSDEQRPQTRPALRESRTARTTVEPQEKNVRPVDEIAEARKRNGLSDPWRQLWRRTLDQVSY